MQHLPKLCQLIIWFWTTLQTNPAVLAEGQPCHECDKVVMTCITSNFLICDIFNLLNRRSVHVIMPDAFVCGFFTSENKASEAALEKGFDVHKSLIEQNVSIGWSHRALRQLIEGTNKWTCLEDKKLVEDGWLGLHIAQTNCQNICIDCPQLPNNIFDETYAKMPLQFQTACDAVCPSFSDSKSDQTNQAQTQYTLRLQFIYSRTSLYPGQRAALTPTEEHQVQTAAAEIFYLLRPRWGSVRPITASNLPALFLAGVVITGQAIVPEHAPPVAFTNSDNNKPHFAHPQPLDQIQNLLPKDKGDELRAEILSYIDLMNEQASGWNFACAANALRTLHEVQRAAREEGRVVGGWEEGERRARALDWWVVLKERGLLDVSWYGI